MYLVPLFIILFQWVFFCRNFVSVCINTSTGIFSSYNWLYVLIIKSKMGKIIWIYPVFLHLWKMQTCNYNYFKCEWVKNCWHRIHCSLWSVILHNGTYAVNSLSYMQVPTTGWEQCLYSVDNNNFSCMHQLLHMYVCMYLCMCLCVYVCQCVSACVSLCVFRMKCHLHRLNWKSCRKHWTCLPVKLMM